MNYCGFLKASLHSFYLFHPVLDPFLRSRNIFAIWIVKDCEGLHAQTLHFSWGGMYIDYVFFFSEFLKY